MTARTVAASFGIAVGLALAGASPASADTINLKIASGHPPGVHYVDMLHEWFIPELKSRAKAKGHDVSVNELFAGSVVKLSETLEGVQQGIVDIGGMCYCFEPSDLMLHAFQVWLPFGTSDPVLSVKIAREVYGQTPELANVFPDKWNQKLLGLFSQDPYDLHAKFEIAKVEDVRGKKVGGAGPNLPWVGIAGGIVVQTTGATVYTSLQTGVFDGVISFVSISQGVKLYELAKYYTKVGFGSITFHGIQINNKSFASLPPDMQQILVGLGKEFEERSGAYVNARVERGFESMKKEGLIVSELPAAEKAKWGELLKDWPNEKAKEADAKGLPGSKTLKLTLDTAEKMGYKWPNRYVIK
ncbi:MAG: C4-dicarboxylate TRAP transporter substrate-binding protein [Alphaproteobacteria bacterium]